MNIFKTIFGIPEDKYYPYLPSELDLRTFLPRNNLKNLRVLNVGVGCGHSALARQIPYLEFGELDLLDVHLPYLEAAKTREYEAGIVNFIHGDVRKVDFSKYDLVMIFDVLEHLPKDDSLAVMEKIKCRQLIFIPLEKHFRKNTFGAESQDHLSLWTEEDFKSRGYDTEVLENFHEEDGERFDALWATKK